MDQQSLKVRYQNVLKDYLERREEKSLCQAAEIGKEALKEKIDPEEVIRLHYTVLKELSKEKKYAGGQDILTSFKLLLKTITAYGKAYREYLESKEKEAERWREINQAKTEFVRSVSHEIKAPLTAILGLAEMFKEEPNKKRQTEYINIILDEGTRLARLISELLNVSKIESGYIEFKKQKINIRQIVNECLKILASKAKEKKIAVKTKFPSKLPPLIGDSDRLHEVFLNILSNAFTYCDVGTEVRITCQLNWGEKRVVVKISDNGWGIPEQDLPFIFNKFYRGSNIGRIKGTGLGLSLVNEIIKAHQGEIEVKSQLGKGSTFIVKLPLAKNN
jgi:two-component system phosphate regulon sensor histidine kinase PhoR